MRPSLSSSSSLSLSAPPPPPPPPKKRDRAHTSIDAAGTNHAHATTASGGAKVGEQLQRERGGGQHRRRAARPPPTARPAKKKKSEAPMNWRLVSHRRSVYIAPGTRTLTLRVGGEDDTLSPKRHCLINAGRSSELPERLKFLYLKCAAPARRPLFFPLSVLGRPPR